MSNSKGNANTICPFYIRETGSSLTCEGCMRGSRRRCALGAQPISWPGRTASVCSIISAAARWPALRN